MKVNKLKVLFVCVHNSARSQMAETFLKDFGKERFITESAGIEPGKLNPLVVEVMKEIGYDISNNQPKDVFDFFKQGKLFNYVITVCDESNSERCPIFPGVVNRLHWSFEDPSGFTGTHEEKLAKTRIVREMIRKRVEQFLEETPE